MLWNVSLVYAALQACAIVRKDAGGVMELLVSYCR